MNDVASTGTLVDAAYAQSRAPRGFAHVAGAVTLVVVLLFAFLAVMHEVYGVDVRVLLRDPAETAQIPEYAGAYAYGGVLLLWTAGVSLALAGLMGPGVGSDVRMGPYRIALGAFLCWLAADDLFMIHEWLGLALSRAIGVENEYLGRTRLEGLVFLFYGVVALAGLWHYRDEVRRANPAILAAAIACFGLSAVVDIGGSLLDDAFATGTLAETMRAYAEEMLKVAGILFMAVYAWRAVSSTLPGRPPAAR